ncbi:MAG TPA: AAA family ATPase [Bacteriovoracaceae bacterium]|nr:AAA family ATPase [Bacteriovoracaceae bacterium]
MPISPINLIRRSKKILLLGSSGSGKTVMATTLANMLGLPVIHLDRYRFDPDWVYNSELRSSMLIF